MHLFYLNLAHWKTHLIKTNIERQHNFLLRKIIDQFCADNGMIGESQLRGMIMHSAPNNLPCCFAPTIDITWIWTPTSLTDRTSSGLTLKLHTIFPRSLSLPPHYIMPPLFSYLFASFTTPHSCTFTSNPQNIKILQNLSLSLFSSFLPNALLLVTFLLLLFFSFLCIFVHAWVHTYTSKCESACACNWESIQGLNSNTICFSLGLKKRT